MQLITTRKRSLRRLCFYTCLSVILFTGAVCLSACWDSRPPGGRHPPPQEQAPPAQCMLGDTANNRAVRILLECILVNKNVCRWSESRNRSSTFMFRDQAYPSASAALEAYILDYEGIAPESSLLKSQRYSSDVDKLLSSQLGTF